MTSDIVNFPLFKYRLTMADSPEISILENCSTSDLSQLRGEIEADLTDLKRMVVTGNNQLTQAYIQKESAN